MKTWTRYGSINCFKSVSKRFSLRTAGLLVSVVLGINLCTVGCEPEPPECSMIVTATAYNSVRSQTDSEPSIAAWGDRLKPGMKAVAVSPDLVQEGLKRGTILRIEGLTGEYVVLDKTASSFNKRIDIYMGVDVEKAKQFGVRQLRIYWSD